MWISKSEIATLTGHTRATVGKYLEGFKSKKGEKGAELYESTDVLVLRKSQDDKGISNAESIRLLNLARKHEIELDMEIKRGQRLPIEDVLSTNNEIFQSISGVVKASKIPLDSANEIFDLLRRPAEAILAE